MRWGCRGATRRSQRELLLDRDFAWAKNNQRGVGVATGSAETRTPRGGPREVQGGDLPVGRMLCRLRSQSARLLVPGGDGTGGADEHRRRHPRLPGGRGTLPEGSEVREIEVTI